MSLNESIVEDAALEWFLLRPVRQAQGYDGQVGELVPQSREVRHGVAFAGLRRAKPSLAPGELASRDCGRDSFGEPVLVGRLCEAIRRPAAAGLAFPFRTLATLRDTLLPKLLSGELSVAVEDKPLEDAA